MHIAPLDRSEWRKNVLAQFDKMRSHAESYEVAYGGKTITILPKVFSPKYFTDSLWFAEQLATIVGQKSLLEIGTGTGIIALFSALEGASVVATDINPEAIKNATLNFQRYNLNVSVRAGDVYEPISENEKFDFIFWNHPFNNWETPVEEMLLRAGLDHNYEGLAAYIAGAQKHLSENGRLLLGTGNNADHVTINALAAKNNYQLKVLKEEILPIEEGVNVINSYIIYEFCPA